jgi:predicted glycoside hydrolase/deacetylase ChbG (UPF0249 family)
MKKLVVNADDFGLTEGISSGIIEGFNNGIIASASLITTMPAFPHAVGLALENPHLDIGVHLSLTVGQPCAKSAKLAPILKKGMFVQSYRRVIKTVYANDIRLVDIKTEMSAQIRKVQDAGLNITHLDSHQHIHMVPRLFRLLLALMKDHQIPFIRIPNELIRAHNLRNSKGWGLFVLGLIGKLSRKTVIHSGLNTSEYFWGLSCSESMSLHDLICVLRSLRPGINELMCHPGYNDATLKAIYDRPSFRQQELSALTCQEAFDLVAREDIELTNYRTLLHQ